MAPSIRLIRANSLVLIWVPNNVLQIGDSVSPIIQSFEGKENAEEQIAELFKSDLYKNGDLWNQMHCTRGAFG